MVKLNTASINKVEESTLANKLISFVENMDVLDDPQKNSDILNEVHTFLKQSPHAKSLLVDDIKQIFDNRMNQICNQYK